MNDYLQKQSLLHETADQILIELNLLPFLNKFGQTNVVGSYALELMSWEDIDIVVICDPEPEYLFKTIQYLFLKPNIYSLPWVQDFRKSVHRDRPQGLYLQAKYLMRPEIYWKMDIWFLPNTELKAEEDVEKYRSRLNPELRQVILTIKNKMREKLDIGKDISGMDVYAAVIDHNVKDMDSFIKYLIEIGRIKK